MSSCDVNQNNLLNLFLAVHYFSWIDVQISLSFSVTIGAWSYFDCEQQERDWTGIFILVGFFSSRGCIFSLLFFTGVIILLFQGVGLYSRVGLHSSWYGSHLNTKPDTLCSIIIFAKFAAKGHGKPQNF